MKIQGKPILKETPIDPGVYIYKDENSEIIYIGKAKNLKKRISSYFNSNEISLKTKHLVSRIKEIEWIIVNNEVEALLLENNLIKKHSPKYNINLKDSKRYAYIEITNEEFPRIFSSRKVKSGNAYFGPYTDGNLRREILKIIPRVFKISNCTHDIKKKCLNYHLKNCISYYIENVSKEEYNLRISKVKKFLKGDIQEISELLEKEMKIASLDKKYEIALELRNQIEIIKGISERQRVELIKSYDQDVVAIVVIGEKAVIEIISINKGVILGKKEFVFEYSEDVFEDFIKRYYSFTKIPKEIIVNQEFWEDEDERKVFEKFISEIKGENVEINCPKKGEKYEIVKLAEKNADILFSKNSILDELKNSLNLPNRPEIIECFDISNLGYEFIVGAMTRFVNGKPEKSGYRKFKIKSRLSSQDDFESIKEIVYRRYSRVKEEKSQMPDLIIIDGGKGQLSSAIYSLNRIGVKIPIVSLAKEFEEIYLPGKETPLKFDKNSKMMLLIRQIRDETHRFVIGYNRKRRQMKLRDEFNNLNK